MGKYQYGRNRLRDVVYGTSLLGGGFVNRYLSPGGPAPAVRVPYRSSRYRSRRPTRPRLPGRRPGPGAMTLLRRKRGRNFYSNQPGCKAGKRRIKRMRSAWTASGDAFIKAGKWHRKLCNGFSTDRSIRARAEVSSVGRVKYWHTFNTLKASISALYALYRRIDNLDAVDTVSFVNNKNAQMVFKATGRVELKNNTGMEIHLTLWRYSTRRNTNITPSIAVTGGLDDYVQVTGVSDPGTDPCLWPENSIDFKQKYRILKKWTACIEPGKSLKLTYGSGWYRCSQNSLDNLSFTHVPGVTTGILFRQRGAIVHDDTALSNVNYGETQLDIMEERNFLYGFYEKDNVCSNSTFQDFGAISAGGVGANMEGLKVEDQAV